MENYDRHYDFYRPKVEKKPGNLPSPTLPSVLLPQTVTTPVKKTHCRSKSDATGIKMCLYFLFTW